MTIEKRTDGRGGCPSENTVCPELGQLINSIRILTENVDKLGGLLSKMAEELHSHDSHAIVIEKEVAKVRECVESQMSNLIQSHMRTQHNLENLSSHTNAFIEHEREFYQEMILKERKHDQNIEKNRQKTDTWVRMKQYALLGSIITAIVTILVLLVEYYFGR